MFSRRDSAVGTCRQHREVVIVKLLRRLLIKAAANHILASEAELERNAQVVWPGHSVLGGCGAKPEPPGWKVCFGEHLGTAFGFLLLTRSPRHGMHSSARQSILDA